MPALPNQKYELFARAVANGQSNTSAYKSAGYSQGATAAAGASRLMKRPEILARIEEYRTDINAKLEATDIANKDWRMRELDELARSIRITRQERARDPMLSRVAGGKTGFQVGRVRFIDVPKDPAKPEAGMQKKMIFEGETDLGLMAEYRAILLQAAREMGQLVEDKNRPGDIAGKDRLNEVVDVIRVGRERRKEIEKAKADAAAAIATEVQAAKDAAAKKAREAGEALPPEVAPGAPATGVVQ